MSSPAPLCWVLSVIPPHFYLHHSHWSLGKVKQRVLELGVCQATKDMGNLLRTKGLSDYAYTGCKVLSHLPSTWPGLFHQCLSLADRILPPERRSEHTSLGSLINLTNAPAKLPTVQLKCLEVSSSFFILHLG